MTDKEKYDFIDHVVHLTLSVEDRLLNEHGGDYSGLEEDGIDFNEYYRIITERVINILKKNNNYMQEEPVSEDLEEASVGWFNSVKYKSDLSGTPINAFKAGAQWQEKQDQSIIELAEDHAMFAGMEKMKEEMMKNIWKPADGEDLPEYDREVIVLIKYNTQRNIHDEEYPTYRVGFGHRPDPKGWEGKSVTTGKVEHYTPKTYDKGGGNIPDVKFWLDVELPKRD